MFNRYSRQIIFPGIGKKGQKKLLDSTVVIIGCGALGSIAATALTRAGVGKLKIIDRDFIEYYNLHRQILFNEDDINSHLPKAVAAERRLKKINSSVEVEGVVSDVNVSNIEKFVQGADLILDGLDNYETRFLINDVSLKHKIPWVYGGVISSYGMCMNIIPGKTPCFRCVYPKIPGSGRILTCETAGLINTVPFIIGSLQATEAIKILVGAEEVNRKLNYLDVWVSGGIFDAFEVNPSKSCPACHGNYEFLEGGFSSTTTMLCGQNSVQLINPGVENISLKELEERLKPLGETVCSDFMLRFFIDEFEMVVFPDGRAIIKNTTDESTARSLYAKYVGR